MERMERMEPNMIDLEPDIIDMLYYYAILIAICTRAHPLDAFIDVIRLIFAWFFSKVVYIAFIKMIERMAEEQN